MRTRAHRGLSGEQFTASEVEVLAEALDEMEQAKRYAAQLVGQGPERAALLRRAGAAARLLRRVEIEEQNKEG